MSGARSSSSDIKKMEDGLCCQITGEIFYRPVTLLPGGQHVVEEDSAKELIRRNQHYPTQTDLVNDYAHNAALQRIVDDYLEANPEARARQHTPNSITQQNREEKSALPHQQMRHTVAQDPNEVQQLQQALFEQAQLALSANQPPLSQLIQQFGLYRQQAAELYQQQESQVRLPVAAAVILYFLN